MSTSKKHGLPEAQRPPAEVTRDLYLTWRSPRLGTQSPHRMTNPVWSWLARQRELNAWAANRHFQGPSSMAVGPAWCGQRFGQSRTALADGRVVWIGGEHEDYYDPDFFIYNDVLVESPDGAVEVWGHPWENLAPTDSHSATLVGDRIVVVGGIDYAHRRQPGVTRVAILDTNDWSARTTLHRDGPGWIHGHTATLDDDGLGLRVQGGIVERGEGPRVEQHDVWRLDLARMTWACVERRTVGQWCIARVDGQRMRLGELGMLRWHRDDRTDFGRQQRDAYRASHGVEPDLDLWDARYALDCAHTRLDDGDDDEAYNVTRLRVGSATVRYVEESHGVRVVIEGSVDDATREAALEGPRRVVERIEGAPCRVTAVS